MWIKRSRYEELIRAEERSEMLRIRVNQLEQESAAAKFAATGIPQLATVLANPNKGPRPKAQGRPATTDEMLGALDFNDLGDENARAEGYALTD